MSLLFNTLSRFATAFLPRRKHLLISWLQPLSAVILEPKKIKSVYFLLFCLPWSDETRCHVLVIWMLSFKPTFSLFYPQQEAFSSSLLSAIRVVSSAYLRLLIFLSIPAYESSRLALCMMYSAYKLNKQGDSIQPWCTPCQSYRQVNKKCKYSWMKSKR